MYLESDFTTKACLAGFLSSLSFIEENHLLFYFMLSLTKSKLNLFIFLNLLILIYYHKPNKDNGDGEWNFIFTTDKSSVHRNFGLTREKCQYKCYWLNISATKKVSLFKSKQVTTLKSTLLSLSSSLLIDSVSSNDKLKSKSILKSKCLLPSHFI